MSEQKINGMTLRFNRNIYILKAIKNTEDAFNELARFEIVKEKNHYRVSVKEIFDDGIKDTLLSEFANYALHQTIAEQKKWQ